MDDPNIPPLPGESPPPDRPLEIWISCHSCGRAVDTQGAFALVYQWGSQTWRISQALCAPCRYALGQTHACEVPSAGIGQEASHHEPSRLYVHLDGRRRPPGEPESGDAAELVLIRRNGNKYCAHAHVRHVQLRRANGSGKPDDLAKIVVWLESSSWIVTDR